MTYVVFGLIALWLILGSDQATALLRAYSPLPERRRFALRILGFLAMGAWMHLLPSVLLVIYMREEGILSTEVLSEDAARSVLASLYLLMPTLAIAGSTCVGAGLSIYLQRRLRPLSWFTAVSAAAVAIALTLCYYMLDGDALSLIFLAIVALPLAIYFHLSLLTEPEKQHRLYWAPFSLICVVTATLFIFSAETYQVISRQLRLFGSGGCSDVKVHFRDMNFAGKLILLTEHSTYILVVADQWEGAECTIRIPASEALIAHTYDSFNSESRVAAAGSGVVKEITEGLPEEYTKNAKSICGPVGKTVTIDQGGTVSQKNMPDLVERRSCSTYSILSNAIRKWRVPAPTGLPEWSTK